MMVNKKLKTINITVLLHLHLKCFSALIIELLSVYVREGLHKLLRFIQTSNMAANFVSLQTKKERLKTITILLQ